MLPQTLQSNKRGVALYDKGILLGFEDIVTVSDEQLAEEAEIKTMSKAEELIDAIGNLSQAKIFLKRLVRRLIKNGVLP